MVQRLSALLALCLTPLLASAQPQPVPHIRLNPISTGLDKPIGVFDDGTGRLFILEQPGRVVILENGQVDSTPFLDIHDEVMSTENECGLLGLAFDPNFKTNHHFYVNYDTYKDGQLQTQISQFTADDMNDHADPSTEKRLLNFDQPYPNHKGGCLMFGGDGMLYDGQGDGGSAGDPHNNGQNLKTYLGKILRIDVEHGNPYAVPADNPFVGKPNTKPEIWAWGMRNPWRFSFDRQTGKLWCGDVGQDLWEEIDIIEKGKNYGWSAREGTHDFKPERAVGTLTEPIKDYPHPYGRCIIGGYVYHGKSIPALDGLYVYGDYNAGWISALGYDGIKITFDSKLLDSPVNICSFGEDRDNELYVCDRDRGTLYMIGP